ncbi:MAG: hypothetical protein HRU20_30550 [Pseudomonadales bacterium]|nr:hypothetical protein [Pseudomonadales bacterium]
MMKKILMILIVSACSAAALAQTPTQPMHKKAPNIQPCSYENNCDAVKVASTSRKVNANGNKKDRDVSTSRKDNANGNKKDRDVSTSRKVNANTPK